MAVAVADGKSRVVAYPDNSRRQQFATGFAVRNGRMYFPIMEVTSDVWVGDVTTK